MRVVEVRGGSFRASKDRTSNRYNHTHEERYTAVIHRVYYTHIIYDAQMIHSQLTHRQQGEGSRKRGKKDTARMNVVRS